jgi:predicted nucleic acid-binding protein
MDVVTPEFTMEEVQEYAGRLATRKGLAPDLVLLAAATLPVTVVPRASYRGSMVEARRRMAQRDPDDVDLLALALKFGVPVWSNDNDFATAGVEWYTTARLLKLLQSL